MISCAFFPTLATTLPIIRHIMNSSTEYSIEVLLSFPGSCPVGQDGSISDCREPLGINVQVDIMKDVFKWERLLVADHKDILNAEKNNEYTKQLIITALHLQKDVVCSKRINKTDYEDFSKLAKDNACRFIYLPSEKDIKPLRNTGALERLHSFYILFGTIVNDSTSMDACFSCAELLSRFHSLSVFSTEENPIIGDVHSLYPIIHSRISESEKVYSINHYFASVESQNHSEITILHLSEPMLSFDDFDPNGFGIIPFLLSKSIPTNLFFCSLPFNYFSKEFAENLSDGVLRQNGYPIDGVVLSNVLIDSSHTSEGSHMSVVHVNKQLIESRAYRNDDSIPAYNLLTLEGKAKIVKAIKEAYSQFMLSRVIP